ncbi:PREDICTED: prolactin-inducible protein [Ceratotherium simum simum]|uniref:Prolactin-inducible protein homolog n=1 Tax=Ceratotherium simum simum TaxID=73337 RepID=A0ABM0HNS2_CERSS|nr:PREDICTED: prolactin-inducible protein [Ceratotherium simum simum]
MRSFQLLFRASPAALLLVLCLQLGINKAQEDTRKAIIMDLEIPQSASPNEEVTAQLIVKTQLRECLVIKSYLVSSAPIDGSFNYKYTSCLCENYPRTFFWDFQINSTVRIAAVVDIIRELNICPNDKAVVPIDANRFQVLTTLIIA